MGKHRINTDERLEFDMTPMIDCCFQLLIFFMLTLKYAALEGDFNIKMPLGAPSVARPDDSALPPVHIRLTADPSGKLTGIMMNQRPVSSFKELQTLVRGIVSSDGGPGSSTKSAEAELDCDYKLKFDYTVRAISAVSGYLASDGKTVVKLIEKVKFAPPRQ